MLGSTTHGRPTVRVLILDTICPCLEPRAPFEKQDKPVC